MANEIQLISDGDGLAVIGHPAAVDRFLTTERLPSKDLGLKRLVSALGTGSKIAKAGSEIAEQSGRWVQLSAESAKAMQKYDLMTGSTSQVSRAVLTDHGKISGLLEIVTAPNAAMLANPALLTGAAGLMAQLAMKQTMDEITDYLAVIDAKVDAVLRAQTDAVVADMIGVELVISEALTIREKVGRVSEITWSKVQATPMPLARAQAYAVRQLDAIAEKLETTNVGDLSRTAKEAEVKVQEWLAVLARCFQLQDAVAVLELDRVLDASPEELEEHRVAIRIARRNRLELISRSTERLLARMDAAAGTANAKVLLNPTSSRAVVHSTNHVATTVVEFNGRLGIERDRQSWNARRWLEAAVEVRDKVLDTGAEVRDKVIDTGTTVGDKVLETGAEGVGAASRFGVKAFGRAKSMMGKVSGEIAGQAQRQLGSKEES
ncbi:hypothetical protein FB565_002395 [Actinoplanes lutulentus]|uniref:Uncharacterized protein n=1 Tax=Actinoplanes lutulentus TaxID=1287878 RepID=A0A327ZJ73_9ACTN|nr:hypothetical protein [Actinoplanes lutulentus]MBB2942682.1 hypothetical protein [Actinoplanes lutulentus]RAK38263.1 hypothetical protein B0I29_105211 [Actinoplanes lutulentus]